MNIHKIFLLAVFTFNPLQAFASEANGTASELNLVEVADGIFVHAGKHVGFEHAHTDDIANIGFIIGDTCIAVIDTGGSVKIAKQLKSAIQQTSDKPICYVINTHVHYDHVLGNIVFKDKDTQFVGHKNLRDSMAYNADFFIEQYSKYLGEHANAEGIVAPDVLVEDTLELDLGKRKLLLKAYPSAHTDTDISIYDAKTNTAWLGDLLFMQRIPVIDGSIKGWLSVNNDLLNKDYEKVIPGHGPASADWPEAIQAQQNYLQTLHDQVSTQIDEGAFMEDVIDSVGNEEKKKWLLHEENHRRNVSKSFTELEW